MKTTTTRFAGRGLAERIVYTVCRAVVATVIRSYTRTRIDGRHHLPKDGAYVLAPVHRSNVDFAIAATLTRRRLRYMGKAELWKSRWFGWLISTLGAFPVNRGTADREALKRCIAVVEAGEPLVLFPEGERKSGPVVHPLFDGAVYVAARAGVPIVPVGIAGSQEVMPKGAKFIHPKRVRVVVGRPLTVPVNESGRVARSAIRKVTDELHTSLQDLFDTAWQRRGGTPTPAATADTSTSADGADDHAPEK